MKKFLLTAALVLALVTSLTAGTMAFYNVSVDNLSSKITTKEFSFTYDTSAGMFGVPIKMAPGDKAVYLVQLKNDSEVNTTATIRAELTSKIGDIPGMTFVMESLNGIETTSSGYTANSTYVMEDKETITYKITVDWAYGNAFDNGDTTRLAGKADAVELNVNINGQQLADGSTVNTHSEEAGVGETITGSLPTQNQD